MRWASLIWSGPTTPRLMRISVQSRFCLAMAYRLRKGRRHKRARADGHPERARSAHRRGMACERERMWGSGDPQKECACRDRGNTVTERIRGNDWIDEFT